MVTEIPLPDSYLLSPELLPPLRKYIMLLFTCNTPHELFPKAESLSHTLFTLPWSTLRHE